MFLKPALWNIGAKFAKNELLAFVDADCYYTKHDWAYEASKCICSNDFCSLACSNIYDEMPDKKIETIGSKWLKRKDMLDKQTSFGHMGFSFGATKNALKEIGYFKTTPRLADV